MDVAFHRIADAVRELVVEEDGWIPADPYLALIQKKKVGSFYEFSESGCWVEFSFSLPARIDKDLSKNAKQLFFSMDTPDGSISRTFYLDGTAEIRRNAANLTIGEMQARLAWQEAAHKAGYPIWLSFDDRSRWLAENHDNLKWSESLRIYIPKTPVGTVTEKGNKRSK